MTNWFRYLILAPTLTTQGTCVNVINCASKGLVVGTPATYTTDAVCCQATYTAGDVCDAHPVGIAATRSKPSGMSPAATVGVGSAVVVVLVVLGAFLWERRSRAKLKRAQSESTSLNERMERLLGAWEILWEHVELEELLAEGSYATPVHHARKPRGGCEEIFVGG